MICIIMTDDNRQIVNLDGGNAANKFVRIPVSELVAVLILAECDSQKRLVQSALSL